ncbi:MAG: ABC transporter permease [Jiangellaceae bacterium]
MLLALLPSNMPPKIRPRLRILPSEVGSRRALGARARHILTQITTEAIPTGILGGLAGLYAGMLAVLAGAVTGMVGGFAAAVRASRIQPIDALRR